jgi:hypothetical protein
MAKPWVFPLMHMQGSVLISVGGSFWRKEVVRQNGEVV